MSSTPTRREPATSLERPAAADVALGAEEGSFGRPRRARVPSLSVVIPCFNEAANLTRLLPRLQQVLGNVTPAWEVILVDDGSTDETSRVLESWSRQRGFRAIQLSRNFGKEAALTAGVDAAQGEATVIMDADLQHSPDLIPTMLAEWQNGYDVVYAVREHRQDESALKRAATRLFYRMVNIGGRFPIPPDAGDFRLMDRAALDALRRLPERSRFMKGLYAWVGFATLEIPYVPESRGAGASSFNLRRLVKLSIDGITAFTTWPLRLVSLIGLLLALGALGYGAYLTVDYLISGNPVAGWTTIVVGLLLSSGIQLFALGILGEYVSRIFEEVKARPVYVVRRDAGHGLPPVQP